MRKEVAGVERKLARVADDVARVHERMASHDPGDYGGLTELAGELRVLENQTAELEERWLELSELLG